MLSTPLNYRCPKCEVQPRVDCVNLKSGLPLVGFHAARVKAAPGAELIKEIGASVRARKAAKGNEPTLSPYHNVLDVFCPVCHARAGSKCTAVHTHVTMSEPHESRIDAYNEMKFSEAEAQDHAAADEAQRRANDPTLAERVEDLERNLAELTRWARTKGF